jgi:hypothetical protein
MSWGSCVFFTISYVLCKLLVPCLKVPPVWPKFFCACLVLQLVNAATVVFALGSLFTTPSMALLALNALLMLFCLRRSATVSTLLCELVHNAHYVAWSSCYGFVMLFFVFYLLLHLCYERDIRFLVIRSRCLHFSLQGCCWYWVGC